MVQSREEDNERAKKRMALGDADAFEWMADRYHSGEGVPQDHEKSAELWRRAGTLGSAKALFNLGVSYQKGIGVNKDTKEERHYLELAAMKGDTKARYNLGCCEETEGNLDRATKHWMIAARSGDQQSLHAIQVQFQLGSATKKDFGDALRAYQTSTHESKSEQRDEAAAFIKERMTSGTGRGEGR